MFRDKKWSAVEETGSANILSIMSLQYVGGKTRQEEEEIGGSTKEGGLREGQKEN